MKEIIACLCASIHVAFEFVIISAFIIGLIFLGAFALHLAQ